MEISTFIPNESVFTQRQEQETTADNTKLNQPRVYFDLAGRTLESALKMRTTC